VNKPLFPEAERLIRILLVEDSPEDVLLTRESLKEAKVANELHVVEDGESALDFVHQRDRFSDAARPDLIILDLNLPRKDGREVLVELKEDADVGRIPVVVLTTSASDQDVLRSYEHHVNAYVRKPVDLDRFVEIVRSIDDFWLGIVTLPPL
jgi:chemotaxis family two-component system response regulator Rcp1